MGPRPAWALWMSILVGCAGAHDEEEARGEDEARAARPCPAVERGICRPVRSAETRALVSVPSIVMPSVTFSLERGAFVAFVASYADSALVRTTSSDLKSFSRAVPVTGETGDATGAIGKSGAALYLVGGSGANAGLYRAPLSAEGEVGPPAPLTIPGLPTSTAHWPQAASLPGGRVLLTFVEPQKRAFLASSDDGRSFTARPTPVPQGDRPGILAHVGATRRGDWVFTHQVANAAWQWTSFVHVSRDEGATWSAPIVVAPEADDVHDAFPLARKDEGADLYYLHLGEGGVFSAHRRAMMDDGRLGPEQAVTAPDVGHIEKPQARRLPDGRVALTFAVRRAETAYDVRLAILEGDAPLR